VGLARAGAATRTVMINGHVRFASESGHVQCNGGRLLWANSGRFDDNAIACIPT
jgi:hypothetical protein